MREIEYSLNKTGILHLNAEGNLIEKKAINGRYPIVLTQDNGYFFTENINQSVHVVKLNSSERREWDSAIPVTVPFEFSFDKIIQTVDGGFVIVYSQWAGPIHLS